MSICRFWPGARNRRSERRGPARQHHAERRHRIFNLSDFHRRRRVRRCRPLPASIDAGGLHRARLPGRTLGAGTRHRRHHHSRHRPRGHHIPSLSARPKPAPPETAADAARSDTRDTVELAGLRHCRLPDCLGIRLFHGGVFSHRRRHDVLQHHHRLETTANHGTSSPPCG